jgi:hypothetical protein
MVKWTLAPMDKTELESILNLYNFDYCYLNGKVILYPSPYNTSNLESFYWYLKVTAANNQNWTCLCNKRLFSSVDDLHHGLLTRQDVRGLRKESRLLIHHSLNVLCLCRRCHEQINKDVSLAKLSELYGLANLQSWYYSIPLKCYPRQI